jgi:arylsulfatase A-like enzyme
MPNNKPNILLITTDTQRWDTLRCMGNPHAISPNIDALAAQGVLFTQAHTSSPVCMPARCSLLTGLHTPVHGCIENGIDRRTDVPVFTDALKAQGYTNIMVGKTHFGPIPSSFDIQYVLNGEKSSNKNDFYAEHIRAHGYSRSSSYPNPIPEDLFMDSFLADTTMNCIDSVLQEGKGPFFAFCSMESPHGPIDPPGKWASLYDGVPLPKINYRSGEIETHPDHLRRLVGTLSENTEQEQNVRAGNDFGYLTQLSPFAKLNEAMGNTIDALSPQEIDGFRILYYGLAAYCDHQVGRLMSYLDKKGLRENTLVIFTSDHGQQYFDHGFNDKHNFYDSTWRIPFIMSMPGTLPQNETRDFAIWNDISATILAAAGTSFDSIQGFDLYTPLKEGARSPRRCAVATLYKSAALATERWKLEYYFEDGTGRLFDRKADPQEQNDLYHEPAYANLAAELTVALLTWRADLCDVNYLKQKTRGGGPVAKRVSVYNKSIRGTDAEERLNRRMENICSDDCR